LNPVAVVVQVYTDPVVGDVVGVKVSITDCPGSSRLLPVADIVIDPPAMLLDHVFPEGTELIVTEFTAYPAGIITVAELNRVFPESRFVMVMLYCWLIPEWNVVGVIVERNASEPYMLKELLVPVAPPLEADNVTPNPAWFIVTVPVHCPPVKVMGVGLIVPGPVVAVIEVEPLYPVAVFPYWSFAVIVIAKPALIVLGLIMLLNVNWFIEAGFTVIEPVVADRIESVTVTVRVPAVLNENPSKMCVP
jgi:hypothetical protein